MPGYGGASATTQNVNTNEDESFSNMNFLSHIGNKQNLIILLLLAILCLLIYNSFRLHNSFTLHKK